MADEKKDVSKESEEKEMNNQRSLTDKKFSNSVTDYRTILAHLGELNGKRGGLLDDFQTLSNKGLTEVNKVAQDVRKEPEGKETLVAEEEEESPNYNSAGMQIKRTDAKKRLQDLLPHLEHQDKKRKQKNEVMVGKGVSLKPKRNATMTLDQRSVADIKLVVQEAVREEMRRAEPVRNTGTTVSRGTSPILQTDSSHPRQTGIDCMCCFVECTCKCHSRNLKEHLGGHKAGRHKRSKKRKDHGHRVKRNREALQSLGTRHQVADLQTKTRKWMDRPKTKACNTLPNYPHWNDPSSSSSDSDHGDPDKDIPHQDENKKTSSRRKPNNMAIRKLTADPEKAHGATQGQDGCQTKKYRSLSEVLISKGSMRLPGDEHSFRTKNSNPQNNLSSEKETRNMHTESDGQEQVPEQGQTEKRTVVESDTSSLGTMCLDSLFEGQTEIEPVPQSTGLNASGVQYDTNFEEHMDEYKDDSYLASIGTWQTALEDENETMMMKLIQDGTLPENIELDRVFKLYRHNAITATSIKDICSIVCQHIQVSCDRIKSVYASYTADKPEDLVFVIMADEDVQLDTDYSYIVCHPGGYSEEGSYITYNDIRKEKRITPDESDNIAAAIQEHSEDLFKKHSNINMISGCSVKSRGFGTEHSAIDRQTCIVIYVGVKGQIPLHESLFPDRIAVPGTDMFFPVDVREGGMRFFGKPHEYHKNLKMGCQIRDKKSAGTLGAIIEDNDGHTYCLTSAHVFFRNQNKDLLNMVKGGTGEYIRPEQDRTRDICVYQCDLNKPFGVVAYATYKKGNNQIAGIDVAVIDITDQSRIPNDGSFPEGNMEPLGFTSDTPMVYTKGKIFDQSSFNDHVKRHTEVVKYGSETKYTKGVFDMQGLCVRRIDYTDTTQNIILNNQLVVLSAGDPNTNPFAYLGDSGALVFAKYEGNRLDLRAVGIVEGGTSNNTVAVTPLWDVFACLDRNPQAGLKIFEPLLRIDSGYRSLSPRTSPTLPFSVNADEQARSQEIAQHFLENQQKQTQEFTKLEDRMNTRLETIENMQREQQEKNEQTQIQQCTRLEKIERLTESMQKEQQDKNEQAQNQQKALEDKMTQMMGMMQALLMKK